MISERYSCAPKTVSEAKKIKKRKLSANRTARVTGRHSFHRQVTNPEVENIKNTPSFL